MTGGAGGIGAATCRRLAAEGARVAVTDLQLDAAQAIADEIDGQAYVLDVSSDDSIGQAVAAAESDLGRIDVLVNNAGYDEWGWFGQTQPEMWDRVLAVNLRGVLAVTHAVLSGMQGRGGGRIVNVASEAGRAGSAGSAAYSAAKAGVIGFAKALAQENASRGITVNVIAPGYNATEMVRAVPEEVLKSKILPLIPVGRLGEAEEIARAVLFLAGEDGGFITGSTLSINGGQHMY